MRCNVRWTNRDGSPGIGVLTMSDADLPPSADKEIPIVVVQGGSALTENDFAGTPLQRMAPIDNELARRASEAGFRFA